MRILAPVAFALILLLASFPTLAADTAIDCRPGSIKDDPAWYCPPKMKKVIEGGSCTCKPPTSVPPVVTIPPVDKPYDYCRCPKGATFTSAGKQDRDYISKKPAYGATPERKKTNVEVITCKKPDGELIFELLQGSVTKSGVCDCDTGEAPFRASDGVYHCIVVADARDCIGDYGGEITRHPGREQYPSSFAAYDPESNSSYRRLARADKNGDVAMTPKLERNGKKELSGGKPVLRPDFIFNDDIVPYDPGDPDSGPIEDTNPPTDHAFSGKLIVVDLQGNPVLENGKKIYRPLYVLQPPADGRYYNRDTAYGKAGCQCAFRTPIELDPEKKPGIYTCMPNKKN